MNSKKFTVEIVGDLDYEELVADICWNKTHTVAMITQENGVENMEIEIFVPAGGLTTWKFPLDDFLKTLEKAKKVLSERLPEE